MNIPTLKGTITAIITPFKNTSIDYEAYKYLLDLQLKAKVNGIVSCGSTGEAATMSEDEHKKTIECAVEHIGKKIPVIAGTGSNDTLKTIRMTQFAKEAGADAALVVVPFYNKPTQEGLIQHFSTVAEKTDFPIVLYNVPGRTGTNMLPETVHKLASIPSIIALKDAAGCITQTSETLAGTPPTIPILSGDDPLTFSMMGLGAQGVISVTSNVVPEQVRALTDACLEKDWERAKQLHFQLMPIHKALFLESNPIPVKEAIHHIHPTIQPEVRLPLTTMTGSNKEKLIQTLKKYV